MQAATCAFITILRVSQDQDQQQHALEPNDQDLPLCLGSPCSPSGTSNCATNGDDTDGDHDHIDHDNVDHDDVDYDNIDHDHVDNARTTYPPSYTLGRPTQTRWWRQPHWQQWSPQTSATSCTWMT